MNDFLDHRRATGITSSTLVKDHQFLARLYGWLHAESELPGRNPMARVARPKGAGRVDPARIGYVSDADYHRLISSFDMRLTLDCRNAAICSLMYWSGVRRSEVVRIDLDRVDIDRARLQVIGKNGEWGTVVILDETVTLLRRYLRRRGPDHHAALFVGTSATTAHDGRLRPDAISSMLERRCKKLGIDVSAHQFRRAMAINAKARGMNDTTVQHIGRWTDPRMVQQLPAGRPGRTVRSRVPGRQTRQPARSAPRRLRAIK